MIALKESKRWQYASEKETAAVVAVAFFVFAVALTPVTWFLGLVGFWFIPFVLVTDVGLAGLFSSFADGPFTRKSQKNQER